MRSDVDTAMIANVLYVEDEPLIYGEGRYGLRHRNPNLILD